MGHTFLFQLILWNYPTSYSRNLSVLFTKDSKGYMLSR